MTDLNVDNLPATLRTLKSRPLMTLRLDVQGPADLGSTPGANRKVGVITGGSFTGDRLRGEVLAGGSDWQTVRTDGAWTIDARIVLRTDDGVLIGMSYCGIRAGAADILAKLPTGGVDPADYYFRVTPLFETSAEKYDWMNRIVTVGIGHRFPDGPLYSFFEIL